MPFLFDTDAISETLRKRPATAIRFDLELVTGDLRHFSRMPGLVTSDVLARCREG